MYINGILFLTFICHKLYYSTAQYVPSKKKNNYIDCMNEIFNTYQFGEFNKKSIHCNEEFKFILQDFANENNITLLCAPSQAHAPCAERNIRTIKERVQSLFKNLPFRGLPKIILQHLVVQTTATLNYFPTRYGLSKYYSPRMIVQHILINYDMRCKHFTGKYVLAHDNRQIKNNMQLRAIICIHLKPSSTSKNVHEFCTIVTKKIYYKTILYNDDFTRIVMNIIEK